MCSVLCRVQCEELLHEEGQFIVRESTTAPGQFVLSSYTAGRIRHLILVDQTGTVSVSLGVPYFTLLSIGM